MIAAVEFHACIEMALQRDTYGLGKSSCHVKRHGGDTYSLVTTIWSKTVMLQSISVGSSDGPLTRYVKLRVAHAPGRPGNVFPTHRLQRKQLVSDPGMHHGTCVMHVPWCMSGSLTSGGGENVPGIPVVCATAILRIWQEAHTDVHFIWFSTMYLNPETDVTTFYGRLYLSLFEDGQVISANVLIRRTHLQ